MESEAQRRERCPGKDDPEERCPRHPKDCICWTVDLDRPIGKLPWYLRLTAAVRTAGDRHD